MSIGDRVLGNTNPLPMVWRNDPKKRRNYRYISCPRTFWGTVTAINGDTITVTSPNGVVQTDRREFYSKML